MTFTVTYRGAKGAPVTEAVEAADRAECLAQLKKRGIAPTSVKEGGAKQDKKAVRGKAKPTGGNSVAYVLLAACALLAVLGGIWLFGRGKEQPSQDGEVVRKPSALAKEVKPAKAAKPQAEPVEPKVVVTDPRYEVPDGAYRDERGVLRRPGGMRILEKPPARTINLFDENQPRVFSNMVNNAIAGMLSALSSGSTVMLKPSGYGPHFARNLERALKEPIVIHESDSEQVQQLKRDVQAVHKELKERMAQGEDASTLLREARRQVYEVNMYRHRLRGEIAKYAQQENVTAQDCRDFTEAANALLAERGAKPLALPQLVARALRNAENAQEDNKSTESTGKNR